MEFNGISAEAIGLLAQNRFENSKAFYEAHKKEINEGVVYPMRRLVEDLRPTLEAINPDLILDPLRCLSRVRRDTRFTNDKTLYRENLWLMFRHQKNELPTPMFWFEFFPDGYSYGCATVSSTPAFLEAWRAGIRRDPLPLLDAVRKAATKGLAPGGEYYECYKRSKAAQDGISQEELIPWYDAKGPIAIRHVAGVAGLNKPRKLVSELTAAYEAAGDLYRYMLDATTRFNARECADERD